MDDTYNIPEPVIIPDWELCGAPRSSHWPAVRDAHLEECPECAACGGTTDLEVHHVVPFHKDESLELDQKNLITLCRRPSRMCHWVFGHLALSWSASNQHVREDAKRMRTRVEEYKKNA